MPFAFQVLSIMFAPSLRLISKNKIQSAVVLLWIFCIVFGSYVYGEKGAAIGLFSLPICICVYAIGAITYEWIAESVRKARIYEQSKPKDEHDTSNKKV